MATAVTELGDRLPASFVQTHKRQRLIHAFAELVYEGSYEAAKIGDIVTRAGVARKTLYDNFEGKEDLANALVTKVCPALSEVVDLGNQHSALRLTAIELAARHEAGDQAGAIGDAEALRTHLRDLPGSLDMPMVEMGDPLLCTLPSGRHGLPREFVHKNQRARLLAGSAACINERGYQAVTITDIAKAAAVSRRTFYEHFSSKERAAFALTSYMAVPPEGFGLDRGWAQLLVEVIAAAFESEVAAAQKGREIENALSVFVEGATNTDRESAPRSRKRWRAPSAAWV